VGAAVAALAPGRGQFRHDVELLGQMAQVEAAHCPFVAGVSPSVWTTRSRPRRARRRAKPKMGWDIAANKKI
jgi:predicted component of type VI protein secretion system